MRLGRDEHQRQERPGLRGAGQQHAPADRAAPAAGGAGGARPDRRPERVLEQYHSIKPYLVNDDPPPERERPQSPEDREKLNGLYECILCACCTTACPTFWWNPDRFVGPAGLLQAYRFIADTRDTTPSQRLDDLSDAYRLFRCRTIMNCTDVCPKGLNPAAAIGEIRDLLVRRMI